jgi:hypothetical protein
MYKGGTKREHPTVACNCNNKGETSLLWKEIHLLIPLLTSTHSSAVAASYQVVTF